jgi:uncharacterized protein (DUF3084 family)
MARGWTIETLKELIEQRLDSMDKALTAALQATKEAIQKAENANEKRFDGVNEFRGQLGDQARTLMPRSEAEQRMGQMASEISELKTKQERSVGRAGGISGFGAALISIASILIAAASVAIAILK